MNETDKGSLMTGPTAMRPQTVPSPQPSQPQPGLGGLAAARGPAARRAAHGAWMRPGLDPADPAGMGSFRPGRQHRAPGIRADYQHGPGIGRDGRRGHRAAAGLGPRERAVILVWDPSPQPPVPADSGQEAENGRGLLLVQALSTQWGWYFPTGISPGGRDGKVVWAIIG